MNEEAVPRQALKQKPMNITFQIDIVAYTITIKISIITLIHNADTLKKLRKKELYWMYKLKTYVL